MCYNTCSSCFGPPPVFLTCTSAKSKLQTGQLTSAGRSRMGKILIKGNLQKNQVRFVQVELKYPKMIAFNRNVTWMSRRDNIKLNHVRNWNWSETLWILPLLVSIKWLCPERLYETQEKKKKKKSSQGLYSLWCQFQFWQRHGWWQSSPMTQKNTQTSPPLAFGSRFFDDPGNVGSDSLWLHNLTNTHSHIHTLHTVACKSLKAVFFLLQLLPAFWM